MTTQTTARQGRRPLPAHLDEWPEAARDELAERQCILEYDAHMERSRAEKAAERMVRERWERGLI